ncbi:hypothetical protein ACWEKM_35135 [Streptomyces sp. NPDC004752]
MDIPAVLKAHLLETPAAATTPEQTETLKAELLTILQAAAWRPVPTCRTTTGRRSPAEGGVRYLPEHCWPFGSAVLRTR